MRSSLALRRDVQVMTPEEICRLEQMPGQRIVVVEKQRTAGSTFWMVAGSITCLIMLFSFLAWIMRFIAEQSDKAMAAAERESQRAHDLAMKAVDASHQAASMNEGSFVFLVILLAIAVFCLLIAAVKGGG